MKIVTLLGSPRKKGNTATVLGWVEEELKSQGPPRDPNRRGFHRFAGHYPHDFAGKLLGRVPAPAPCQNGHPHPQNASLLENSGRLAARRAGGEYVIHQKRSQPR